MRSPDKCPSREEVLDAFAVEIEPGRPTLERYLRLYPEYAAELIDLSCELRRESCEDASPLSITEQALVDSVWLQYVAASEKACPDPFTSLTVDDWRTVARRLEVPRQVVTALRERRVVLGSIPRWFLERLSEAMGTSLVQLETYWGPTQTALARSYKADGKPSVGKQVNFEQVLIDAGIPVERRTRLLAEAE